MNAIKISEMLDAKVDGMFNAYIEKIAEVYKMSVDDLKTIYIEQKNMVPNCDTVEISERKRLKKLKKPALQEKCKELGHKTTGNKELLVDRIMSGSIIRAGKACRDRGECDGKKIENLKPTPKKSVSVTKSTHGNYVYDGLVIDKGTRMVVGIETETGDIGPLTKIGIDKCHRYKLKFAIPINMNDDRILDDEVEEKNAEDEEEEVIESCEEKDDDDDEEDDEDEDADDDDDDDDDDVEVEVEVEVELEPEVEVEVEPEVEVAESVVDDDDDIEYVYDE